MLSPSHRTVLSSALIVSLLFIGTACSGGGGNAGGGTGLLRITMQNVNDQFAISDGVLGITFLVEGPASTIYDLILQYTIPGTNTTANASQVPVPIASAINAANPGAGVGPIQMFSRQLPALDGEVSELVTFWWYAGADLGFINSAFEFIGTPINSLTEQPGQSGTTGQVFYTGSGGAPGGGTGLPAKSNSGPGVGSGSSGTPAGGTGRAGHTADYVHGDNGPGGENLAVAGGFNGGALPNAFDSIDRFDFDTGAFSHSVASSLMFPGGVTRALHSSSMFIDDATGAIKVLISGGVTQYDPEGAGLANRVSGAVDTNTAAIYCFSPVEQVQATSGNMSTPRYWHSSTWTPSNEIIIVGGAGGTAAPAAVTSIEHFDPNTGLFTSSTASTQPRVGCESALMADGRVFICGGYDPANPTVNVMCEIYDPQTETVTSVTASSSFMNRVNHTVTRMTNGWILIVGGQTASGNLIDTALVYKPEFDNFDSIGMGRGRSLHTATRLANGNVLVAGGIASDFPGGSREVSNQGQVFAVSPSFTAGFTSLLIDNLLATERAEHAAAAVDTGAVMILGGRNNSAVGTGPLGGATINYLDDVELFAFTNSLPQLALPATQVQPASGSIFPINFSVIDAEGDAGYALVRYQDSSNEWKPAQIISNSANGGAAITPANHQVVNGQNVFNWDTSGLTSGDIVTVQIIPFGATIGSPVSFQVQIP